MIEQLKLQIKDKLEDFYLKNYNKELLITVEEPKNQSLGDISIPLFVIFKTLGLKLPDVQKEVTDIIKENFSLVEDIDALGGFINIKINKEILTKKTLTDIVNTKGNYANSNIGENKTIVIDYSSPNIAKSFSVGHLRSTMIGNSIKLILQKCGYKTVGINYLGDWGTQFGKMIAAYELWGDIEEIKKDSIKALSELYVRFNKEAETNKELDDLAREYFRKIELGEEKYLNLWKYFKEESLKESQEIYDLLDIEFDSYTGEAYYNDKMDSVVEELNEKNLLKLDDGALIVELNEDLPPALIKRKDGGSLYITRDLAAVFDRKNTYNFDKCLYVVGNEQKLHFTQLGLLLEKMNKDFYNDIVHVNFGLYLTNGKKMSTRKGNVVKLYDVIYEAINMSLEMINSKNPDLENKEEIAKNVGISAIVFADLKNHRTLDIEFSLEQSVRFEGQTGPYVLYTGVRINSILEDNSFNIDNINYQLYSQPHYFEIVKQLSMFQTVIEKAAIDYTPSVICKYLLTLCQSFNKFYSQEKIVCEDIDIKNANLVLIYAIREIINEGLRLLGIKYVDKM